MNNTTKFILFLSLLVFLYLLFKDNQENFYVDNFNRTNKRYDYYPRYWYLNRYRPNFRYTHPWFLGWWGFPSRYDPNYSVPFATTNFRLNPSDNCHKKCADRFNYINDDNQYVYKVKECINNYCY
jgi:hypothetical protein